MSQRISSPKYKHPLNIAGGDQNPTPVPNCQPKAERNSYFYKGYINNDPCQEAENNASVGGETQPAVEESISTISSPTSFWDSTEDYAYTPWRRPPWRSNACCNNNNCCSNANCHYNNNSNSCSNNNYCSDRLRNSPPANNYQNPQPSSYQSAKPCEGEVSKCRAEHRKENSYCKSEKIRQDHCVSNAKMSNDKHSSENLQVCRYEPNGKNATEKSSKGDCKHLNEQVHPPNNSAWCKKVTSKRVSKSNRDSPPTERHLSSAQMNRSDQSCKVRPESVCSKYSCDSSNLSLGKAECTEAHKGHLPTRGSEKAASASKRARCTPATPCKRRRCSDWK